MGRLRKRIWITAGALALFIGALATFVYCQPLWLTDQEVRFHLWRSGVRSEFVDVNGNRIHYFEAFPRAGIGGKPLILIHGLGARGEDWSPLVPGLAAAGFHVYVPDLLGYGRSQHPDVSYSISMQEELVADFIRVMHVEHADVAGWSMGGWVGLKLAVDHGDEVSRLVLFDSAGTYFPGYADLQSTFDAKDIAGVNRLFAMLTPNPKPMPEFVAKAVARRIQGNIWVVKRSMAAMTNGRDLMDFRLHEIKQPTLVVWGKQDTLIPLSSGEKLHRGINNSSLLILDGCGHIAPAECSNVSLQAMVDFLQAQPPLIGVVRTVAAAQ